LHCLQYHGEPCTPDGIAEALITISEKYGGALANLSSPQSFLCCHPILRKNNPIETSMCSDVLEKYMEDEVTQFARPGTLLLLTTRVERTCNDTGYDVQPSSQLFHSGAICNVASLLPAAVLCVACVYMAGGMAAAAIVVIIVKRVEKLPSHDIICTDRPAHKSIL
jgi:hypothetical protein